MVTSAYVVSVPRYFELRRGDSAIAYNRAWFPCAQVLLVVIHQPITREQVEAVREARARSIPVEWVTLSGQIQSDDWRDHWREGDLTIGLPGGKVDT
jgi:hypothetical protein